MGNGGISQSGGESRNDALHKCRELMKRCDERPTLNNPRLAQRYIEGKLLVGTWFRIHSHDQKFTTLFQGESFVGGLDVEAITLLQQSAHRLGHLGEQTNNDVIHAHASKVGPDGEQNPVLLDVVKSIERPEEIVPSTLIWFESVNGIDRVLRRSLYFSTFFGFVFRGVILNGKVDPIGVWRSVPRIAAHNLIGEMV